MREAHLDVFEANADIIASVQWVSTLDNRTTPMCRHLDGKEWTIPGYEPKGHNTPFPGTSAHWNCRSVVIPITKTWEQLAKEAGGDAEFAKKLDAIPKGERASMGGPVDAGTTYEAWFGEQDRERQLEILGPGRMEMYERGALRVSDMARMDGSPMTLAELEAKIEDVKYEIVTGPFNTFYDPMKAIYDELMLKHGGNFDKVRENMPKKNYVASILPEHIKKALETEAESIWLSADGLAKQLNHHPELTIEEYVSVFSKLKECKEIYKSIDERVALIVKDGKHYAVILKTTDNKLESYLISLHRLDKHSLSQFRKLKRIY